jgi:2-succinyl-5-enolpyruvyl-6-hydroxy-3-cyclohexene-1-carboxylate synthase
MSSQETLSKYVYTIVNSFIQAGVEDVVVSPGSRSTPLAYAFASLQDELNVYRHIDERAAGFFALGLAKASGKPVVLVCTSGTAAANYYPAIIEAKYARVPLIICTADRPHELREVGAPQTINQVRIYGENVKWSAEFPLPDDAPETLPYLARHTARAAAIACAYPMGPVHMNIPFREPLIIDFHYKGLEVAFQKSYPSPLQPGAEAVEDLQSIINFTAKGIIVVGELPLATDRRDLWEFIERLKWPVLVESLSNMRTNIPERCLPYIISTYDAVLKVESLKQQLKVDTVIRFGAQPVSKFLMQFITTSKPKHFVVVDEDPMFRDSTSMSTHYIHGAINDWLRYVDFQAQPESTYLKQWQHVEKLAVERIQQYKEWSTDEGAQVYQLLQTIPNGADLFVSSSMPIRDIDTFLVSTTKDLRIFANRGANGIDGVISTAFGFSAANPSRPTYLLIGDLAFLHDSNAFVATRYQPVNLHVIVMNNDGGGIFSYLPQAKVEAHYEELFGTPTALTFEHLAQMYDLPYQKVEAGEALTTQHVEQSITAVTEVFTNRDENTANHRKLWQQVAEDVTAWLSIK